MAAKVSYSAGVKIMGRVHPVSVLLSAAAAVMFFPVFSHLASYGWKAAEYTHGYFILPVSLWIIFQKKHDLVIQTEFSIAGWMIFGFGAALYLFASLSSFMFLEALSFVIVMCGLMRVRFTAESFKHVLFPLSYLLFLVPPPSLALDFATFPLKKLSSVGSYMIMKAAGLPVMIEGTILKVGSYELFVSDACSGFRSIITLLALAAVYAYFLKTTRNRKIAIFLLVIPLGIGGNILRIFLTGVISHAAGIQYAEGFFHGFSGALFFLVAIGGLMFVADRLGTEPRHADR